MNANIPIKLAMMIIAHSDKVGTGVRSNIDAEEVTES